VPVYAPTMAGGAVLITGASSGIGSACARLLDQRGFEVLGTSRRDPAELSDRPAGVRWIPLPVDDETSVQTGFRTALGLAPDLAAVVCNAGFGIFGSLEEVPIEAARMQFETNVFGVLRTLRAALPHLRARGAGRVVLVGSLAGRAPIPFQGHYSASKAATEALALSLRNELRPHGVHVSLVEPGDIQTPFNTATDFGLAVDSAYGERIARCRQVIEESLPRAPGPERVARVVHRALTARRPRVRYTVGPDSWLVPFGRRFLPDSLMLRFIRAHFRV
jgi:NAD(P)-dependent dehydrogenase (short-subunit alcohol dehydrogenase family)